MNTLNYLLGRRLWIVRDYNVWGNPNDIEFLYLATETSGSEERMLFGRNSVSDAVQNVSYADLSDWRGNNLPGTIASPWVIVVPKSEYGAFVVGNQSSSGFRIARDPGAPGAVTADLFIFEMGER